MRFRGLLLALVLLLAWGTTHPAPSLATQLYDDFSDTPYTLNAGAISPNGKWQNVFTGGGATGVTIDDAGRHVLFERPAAATTPSQINPDGTTTSGTHAALVLTTQIFTDFTLSLDVRTDRQLRLNSPPNPWETAWVLFRYVDRGHHDWFYVGTTHYELGKKDTPVVNGQIHELEYFLKTGATPVVTLGAWQHWDLTVIGNHISVAVNGSPVVDYLDAGERRPDGTIIPPMSNFAGQIGLYTEDAAVSFANVSITPLTAVPEPTPAVLLISGFGALRLCSRLRSRRVLNNHPTP